MFNIHTTELHLFVYGHHCLLFVKNAVAITTNVNRIEIGALYTCMDKWLQ